MSDNQVAILTAQGAAAIAVVRLCGSEAGSFLRSHFSSALRNGVPVHGRLMNGSREIDDPLVVWDEAGQTADICTHGGSWIVHEVVELARRDGFDFLDAAAPLPGMAVDADDGLEREIIQYLPLARTREAIETLLNQRMAWQALLSGEVGEAQKQQALQDKSLQYLLNPPRIVIIGVPNAGKSTLANVLFRHDRSIVADMPGTTRDYVEDFANLGGLPVRLIDTPGLRSDADEIEKEAVSISREQIVSADLCIVLFDPTQRGETQDNLLALYPDAVVVNAKAELAITREGLAISAKTGQGIAGLEIAIRRRFHCETLPHGRPCAWTDRQRLLLQLRGPLTQSSF